MAVRYLLGFAAAATFLTAAFLIAYAARAGRLGYAAAGMLAGLSYTLADMLHAQSAPLRAAAHGIGHFFDWMHFIHNLGERNSEWFTWGLSTMIAGALAGLVFARITRTLRNPMRAPEKAGISAVKIH